MGLRTFIGCVASIAIDILTGPADYGEDEEFLLYDIANHAKVPDAKAP